jgi:hypothetical protein
MTAETRVPVQPEGRRTVSAKEKAELLLALLCAALLFAAFGFSELDNDYATSTRLTAAIRRIVGHAHSKTSASKPPQQNTN